MVLIKFGENFKYYYLYDANGNVGQLINAADGSIAAHYEYDPFGNITAKSGTYADANPFRFSTKHFDRETGLYNFGLRDYSPKLGRWTSRDPIGEDGGINLYGFVWNSPVNNRDSLGLSANIIKIAFLGAAQDASWPGWPSHIKKTDVKILASRDSSAAENYLIEKLDSNNDGKLDCGDDEADIRIVGYSWGGWSALLLSQWLAESNKIGDDKLRKISRLGTLDPVDTARPGDPLVPSNVKYALNIYQLNGCYAVRAKSCLGIGGQIRGCFMASSWYRGVALSGNNVINKDVSGDGIKLYGGFLPSIDGVPVNYIPDHLHLGYSDWGPDGDNSSNSYAKQIADLLN